jgi:ABC-type antimicrobial peptide transport system permease subunit
VLAGIGLFGLFSHDVASRRRELAVRVALGATPRVLRRAVFSQVGLMLALGVGAGVMRATLVAATLKRLLFGTPGTVPVAFLTAGGVVVLVALVAAAAPARRAAASDPIVVLNAE